MDKKILFSFIKQCAIYMQDNYKTTRLLLRKLTLGDAAFIFELVNTAGWIKFIGDRNVNDLEAATTYIQKIISNPDIQYRVVILQHTQTAIGLITFIKRNYLNHSDIGFAFLPAFAKQGYAFEAANEVLTNLLNFKLHETILATTIPENSSSIQLLKKLGFSLSKQITHENLALEVYSISKLNINSNLGITHFIRTNSNNTDFQKLITLLDADLRVRDGDEHDFYAQFNKIATIRNVIVCYVGDKAIGCGAFKDYDELKVEIKRMFVLPQYRGHGIAMKILNELELWAAELNYKDFVLETGKKQPEAIRLYQKSGYSVIPNYGQYKYIENSVCMMKTVL
jgi:putative acetyltransferase